MTRGPVTLGGMLPALQAPGSVGLRLDVSGIGAASTVAFEDYRVVAVR